MKILRILLRNLHSIRSEVEIDFSKSPLSDTGLFAITGDTGAGKTTVLDAITLAMYGDICRKAKPEEALSYGAEEGFAECEFEAKGRRYLSQWRVRTTRSKDPSKRLKTERSIAEWDAKTDAFHIIAERKVREVNALVEEVTGLDFPRFTRSVLLAQGDFAAFLKASEKERSDLLERITGTEIYSELSKAALTRRNIEQDELTKLTTQREALHLLSTTDLAEKKRELKEKKNEDKAIVKNLKGLQAKIELLTKIERLKSNKSKLETEKERLSTAFEKIAIDLKKLNAHQKIAPLRPDLERLQDRKEDVEKLKTEVNALNIDIEKLSGDKKGSDFKLEKAKSKFDNLKKGQKAALKLFDEVSTLDEKIKVQLEHFSLQKNNLEEQELQFKTIERKKAELQKEIEEKKRKEKENKAWLNQNKAASNLIKELPLIKNYRDSLRDIFSSKKTLKDTLKSSETKLEEINKNEEKLEAAWKEENKKFETIVQKFTAKSPDDSPASRHELLEKLNKEIESAGGSQERLRQLGNLNDTYAKLLHEATELETELGNLQKEEMALDKKLLTLDEASQGIEKKVHFKREIYNQQLLVANFEQARAALKEGEECPVCLSTEHPFRSNTVEPFVDEAKAELEQAEKDFTTLQKEINHLSKRHAEIATAIHRVDSSTAGQLGKINTQVLEVERNMAALLPHFGADEFGLSHGDFLKQKLENFESDLAAKKELRQELSVLNNQINIQEKKVSEISNQRKELEIKQASLKENNQSNEKILSEHKAKFKSTVNNLDELLKNYGYEFSIESANTMFVDLENRELEFSERKNTQDSLQKNLALLLQQEEQILTSNAELSKKIKSAREHYKKDESTYNQLKSNRLSIFNDKSPEVERDNLLKEIEESEDLLNKEKEVIEKIKSDLNVAEKTVKDKSSNLLKLNSSIKILEEKLSEKLVEFGFSELSEMRDVILPEIEIERIQLNQENLRKRQIEMEQDKRNLETEWEIAHKNPLPEKSIDELKLEADILDKNTRDIQQQIGAIQQQLLDNESRGAEATRLLESIAQQRKIFNRWNDLYDLIGSSDGKKFRVFAQGLTLQKLVQLANVHLANLHGRYFIVKRSGEDLELDIVDTYQAENMRSMHTLSGGESFLVSLALALGLSDLAGRNANIRSLFIDEGFGTLDDQALDTAITTLENLQARGKTIGVISHVKELKERISTQVRLVKKGGGMSEVEVVG